MRQPDPDQLAALHHHRAGVLCRHQEPGWLNSQHGITIQASDVTIDLGGFPLRGVHNSLNAIYVDCPRENIRIQDGTLWNWGGVAIDALAATSSTVERVRVSNSAFGIWVGADSEVTECLVWNNLFEAVIVGGNSLVQRCTVQGNGSTGLLAADPTLTYGAPAVILDSTFNENGVGMQIGDGSIVKRCRANGNASDGIDIFNSGGQGGLVESCVASENGVIGIYTEARVDVRECVANANGLDGIRSGPEAEVADCVASANVNDGIVVFDVSRVVGCSAGNNGRMGILLPAGNTRGEVLECLLFDNISHGLCADGETLVNGCLAEGNTGDGLNILNGSIIASTSSSNSDNGIVAFGDTLIQDCSSFDNTSRGIAALNGGNTVLRCASTNNGTCGIDVRSEGRVEHCIATNNGADGISVQANSVMLENHSAENSGTGILCLGDIVRVDSNNAVGNGTGIDTGGYLASIPLASGSSSASTTPTQRQQPGAHEVSSRKEFVEKTSPHFPPTHPQDQYFFENFYEIPSAPSSF